MMIKLSKKEWAFVIILLIIGILDIKLTTGLSLGIGTLHIMLFYLIYKLSRKT